MLLNIIWESVSWNDKDNKKINVVYIECKDKYYLYK